MEEKILQTNTPKEAIAGEPTKEKQPEEQEMEGENLNANLL